MPSHTCHELIGCRMGLPLNAVKEADEVIDMPEKHRNEMYEYFPPEIVDEIRHDDHRKWAMDLIRRWLEMRHGSYGRLAADLHYALDYIERWLDPVMTERMEEFGVGYPKGRTGFVSGFATYRFWHPNRPSWRGELLPITSYCPKCNGKNPPINTPEFCRRCEKKEFSESTSEEVTLKQILTYLVKI